MRPTLNTTRRRVQPPYNWRQRRSTGVTSGVPGEATQRGNYENLTEDYGAVSFILAVVCAWRHLRYSDRPTLRTSDLSSGRAANPRGVAAVGCANCALSRRVGFPDIRRVNVS